MLRDSLVPSSLALPCQRSGFCREANVMIISEGEIENKAGNSNTRSSPGLGFQRRPQGLAWGHPLTDEEGNRL